MPTTSISSTEFFTKDFDKDICVLGITRSNTNISFGKSSLTQESRRHPTQDDTSSTKAIGQPKPKEYVHAQGKRREYNRQGSTVPVRSIMRTPPPRQRNSEQHRRSSPLSDSFFSSSILNSVYNYFSPSSLFSPDNNGSSTDSESTKRRRNVSFSLLDNHADNDDFCRRQLNFLDKDHQDYAVGRTHRRCRAHMCMNDILFELDIFDFDPSTNRDDVSIPTLIVFKTRKTCESSYGRHYSSQVKNSYPRYGSLRRYPFTV